MPDAQPEISDPRQRLILQPLFSDRFSKPFPRTSARANDVRKMGTQLAKMSRR
jgi:hypothetical protein